MTVPSVVPVHSDVTAVSAKDTCVETSAASAVASEVPVDAIDPPVENPPGLRNSPKLTLRDDITPQATPTRPIRKELSASPISAASEQFTPRNFSQHSTPCSEIQSGRVSKSPPDSACSGVKSPADSSSRLELILDRMSNVMESRLSTFGSRMEQRFSEFSVFGLL